MDVTVTTETSASSAGELAAVAAATFALACPPGTTDADTADFIFRHLTQDHFRSHLASDIHDVIAARAGRRLVGYALVVHDEPADPEVRAVVVDRPVSEVSKMYVLPDAHGGGVSHALMARAIEEAARRGSVGAWLGVSNVNVRAQRFYAKVGFTCVGRKSFWLNGVEQRDFVMLRPITSGA